MASSTEEHTVPESRNETQVRDGSLRANDQERLGAFSGISARAPRSRGPMVLRHWLRARLETQAVVSGHADHPDQTPWVLIVAKTSAIPGWQLAVLVLTGTVVGVVVVTCLYWAQTIFIPVALAVFLTVLLAPLVTALQRRGLRRLPSVLLVVMLAAAVLGGGVWLVTAQVTSLAGEVPKYTENIKGKVKSLRHLGQGSVTSGLEKMIQRDYRGVGPARGEPKGKGPGQAGGCGLREADRRGAGAGEPGLAGAVAGLAQFPAGDACRPGLGPGTGRFHAAEA